MSADENNTLAITLLGKEYTVTCPPGAEDELRRTAQFLDKRMSDIRSQSSTLGSERIAIMAALNISHDHLSLLNQVQDYDQQYEAQLAALLAKLQGAMPPNEQ
ncbi:MAG: cell division protein ZapA [Pontibacterium sp.]